MSMLEVILKNQEFKLWSMLIKHKLFQTDVFGTSKSDHMKWLVCSVGNGGLEKALNDLPGNLNNIVCSANNKLKHTKMHKNL